MNIQHLVVGDVLTVRLSSGCRNAYAEARVMVSKVEAQRAECKVLDLLDPNLELRDFDSSISFKLDHQMLEAWRVRFVAGTFPAALKMRRWELADWYVQHVGYDPTLDAPNLTDDQLLGDVTEMHWYHEHGLDAAP